MRIDLNLVAAATAIAVSFLAFWSNPTRKINRAFLSLSLHAALWLMCLSQAVEGGDHAQTWMRTTTAVGAFIPLQMWIVKEAIAASEDSLRSVLVRGRWWILGGAVLASVAFTEWFVPTKTGQDVPPFGGGYFAYIAGALIMYGLLCRETVQQIKGRTGVSRVELQLVLLGGSAAALAVILLMSLRTFLAEVPWLMALRPIVVLIFYTGTVVATSTNRILDARQIFAVSVQKFSLVSAVAIFAYLSHFLLSMIVPSWVAFLTTTALALWVGAVLSSWLDRLFSFYPQAGVVRQATFSAAQRETRVENLEKAFSAILKGWGQADRALVVSGTRDLLSGGGVSISGNSVFVETMRQLRWATPERLARERSTPARVAVRDFLVERGLGVLVIEQGPALTVLAGVGIGASRRPFTYPQITQLAELASIMESALERAHFSAKVQHTEQLATVGLLGASLAHEIRNPLVSIKTFVQLLPTHHHDPKFRDKFFKLIGDEVGRIDQLTEQLLDLASPRTYEAKLIELHPLLRSSLDLVSAKAAHRNVEFLTEFGASPDSAFTDASAAKQVMLNLCFNAIQAVEEFRGEQRWVKIATRNTPGGIEMMVADSGPGIPAEMRPKLFQPFQTTKSTGFGLGLAICSDILSNLHASISVDPPLPGQGATFRVTFPCQPLSS